MMLYLDLDEYAVKKTVVVVVVVVAVHKSYVSNSDHVKTVVKIQYIFKQL